MNRRELLGTMATGAAGLLAARRATGGTEGAGSAPAPATRPAATTPPAATAAPIAAGGHVVKPLPFDPKTLRGLSERLLVSHHDNNYAGAVGNLNKVEAEIERAGADAPGFLLAGLKEKELAFRNSMLLHELYFANLGGDGRDPGPIQKDLAAARGTFARWEEEFRAAALALAGGSGWTVLDLELEGGALRTYCATNHTQASALSVPLLVLDMYEHAYHIDFGAAAARYVEAFIANVNWEEVNRRLQRARKAATALTA